MKLKNISIVITSALLSLSLSSPLAANNDLRMIFSQEIWEENQENPLAQFYIAEQHYLANDFDLSLRWYLKAAKNNFKVAVDNAKIMINNDMGVKNNLDEIVEFLTSKGLNENDLFAQMYLGDIYRNGDYNRNHGRSFFWYSKAAQQGEPRAEYYIANMSIAGVGTPQNVPRGVRLLEKVAETNHMGAIYNLGMVYKRGFNINQNHKEAVKWFEMNANLGHVQSMFEVADSYEKGFGVERSPKKALEWYEMAGTHNHVESMNRAGMIHILHRGVSDNFNLSRGLKWLATAAEMKHVDSQLRLGDIYYAGDYGVSKDYLIAEKFYKMAAEQNDQSSFMKLSFIYREGGYGVARSDEKYKEYIERYYTYEPNLLAAPKDKLNLFNYNIFDY